MEPFVFDCPTKIVFGSGSLAQCGSEAKALGKKPLLLTGRTAMQKSGALKKVTGLLAAMGIPPVVFEGVEPNPRVETLDKAVALGLKEKCDLVIALGGGSVMDGSKAVGAALGAPRRSSGQALSLPSVWEFTNALGPKIRPVEKTLPVMLISTTAATGTEGNPASVITKWATHEKAVLWDPGAYPKVSIVDPELMLGLSLEVTRDGAFDIMVHLLENYFSGNDKCSFQDRTTEGMVLGVMENLEVLEKDLGNLCARENLSWASIAALLGGSGPGAGRGGIFTVHNLEHALSGTLDVSHGHGLAALWVPYLRFICPKRAEKIAKFGQACLGVKQSDPDATLAAMEAWLKKHQMWFRLSQLGFTEAMIPKMAEDTIRIYGEGRNFMPAPVRVTKEKAEEIYRSAMN